jgi:glycosyltransferase involved in cell wall biosynthesis
MSEVFVSVVIPFYKGEKYLEKTIDSILQQNYKNFELLIINDGSPK